MERGAGISAFSPFSIPARKAARAADCMDCGYAATKASISALTFSASRFARSKPSTAACFSF